MADSHDETGAWRREGSEAYFRIADVEGRTARGRTSATFVRASETVSWLEPPSDEPARLHTPKTVCRLVVVADAAIAIEALMNNAG